MFAFDVAYVRFEETALVFVPVSALFGRLTRETQLKAAVSFTEYCSRGGLAGPVVPVWRSDRGHAVFFVPPSLAGLVSQQMTWELVNDCLNYRIAVTRLPEKPGRGIAEAPTLASVVQEQDGDFVGSGGTTHPHGQAVR